MFKKAYLLAALCAFCLAIPTFFTACGEDLDDCTAPADDCSCVDGSGAQCDDGTAEDCTCTQIDSPDTTDPSNTTTPSNTDPGSNTTPAAGQYRFVLIEDLTTPTAGDYPGADVDAISVTVDGVESFAASVEDSNISVPAGGNTAIDTNQLLGAPDSDCMANSGKFTALGGLDGDSYVIVGFSDSTNNVTFDSGDSITVYELGATYCTTMPNFDDDPYTVQVSAGSDRGSFTTVGTGGPGQNVFVIP